MKFPTALTVFKLTEFVTNTRLAKLKESLLNCRLCDIGEFDLATAGFVPAHADTDDMLVAVDHIAMLRLGITKRLLPTPVLNKEVAKRLNDHYQENGYHAGKLRKREIKEQALTYLIPKAFPVTKFVNVILDTQKGYLMVDTSSATVCDLVIKHLLKVDCDLPLGALSVCVPPSQRMSQWIQDRDLLPSGWHYNDTTVFAAHSGGTVTYKAVELNDAEIKNCMANNMHVSEMDLCFGDKVTLKLTQNFGIKSIKPTGIYDIENISHEGFAQSLFLAAKTCSNMISDLVFAHGGEGIPSSEPAQDDLV